MDTAEMKKKIRKEVKEMVGKLDREYCRKADRAIFEYITGLSEYKRAGTIFCFVGTADEINTIPVIEDGIAKGKCVCAPVCTGRGIMEARRVSAIGALRKGSYGILEPGEDAPVILPETIDLAIVPCLSCTRDGKRLGYGGGFYDRYLEQTKALRAAICRERIMREDIPMEIFDIRMDLVVSENGAYGMEYT